MKGPGLRVKLDVRRLWRCSTCGYERHASGHETVVRCHCNQDEPFMKLVETQRYSRPETTEPDFYMDFTDEELAALNSDNSLAEEGSAPEAEEFTESDASFEIDESESEEE